MVSVRVPLILGSASPARLSTLQRAGVRPYVLVSDVDEDSVVKRAYSQFGELAPEDVALVLARAKCEASQDSWRTMRLARLMPLSELWFWAATRC